VKVKPVAVRSSGKFWTQKPSFFWIDSRHFSNQPLAVDIVGPNADRGATAVGRVAIVEMYPGFGPRSQSIDCTSGAVHAYDRTKANDAQANDCAITFFQTSRVQPDGVYKVEMRVVWDVVATINGVAQDVEQLEATTFVDVEVRELQAIVVCESTTTSGCRPK
jgi:hypothetical protein